MTALDVVALPMELALERLSQAGILSEIEKTYPTKPAKVNGQWRVVRQTVKDGKTILVVAEECEGVSL